MTEALRERQVAGVAAGMGLAHFDLMDLTTEALELLKHFHKLSEEERERIVRLVRALSRSAELLELQLPATSRLLA